MLWQDVYWKKRHLMTLNVKWNIKYTKIIIIEITCRFCEYFKFVSHIVWLLANIVFSAHCRFIWLYVHDKQFVQLRHNAKHIIMSATLSWIRLMRPYDIVLQILCISNSICRPDAHVWCHTILPHPNKIKQIDSVSTNFMLAMRHSQLSTFYRLILAAF